jgi:hypothetical protein
VLEKLKGNMAAQRQARKGPVAGVGEPTEANAPCYRIRHDFMTSLFDKNDNLLWADPCPSLFAAQDTGAQSGSAWRRNDRQWSMQGLAPSSKKQRPNPNPKAQRNKKNVDNE